jgi:hypothetical protein
MPGLHRAMSKGQRNNLGFEPRMVGEPDVIKSIQHWRGICERCSSPDSSVSIARTELTAEIQCELFEVDLESLDGEYTIYRYQMPTKLMERAVDFA